MVPKFVYEYSKLKSLHKILRVLEVQVVKTVKEKTTLSV